MSNINFFRIMAKGTSLPFINNDYNRLLCDMGGTLDLRTLNQWFTGSIINSPYYAQDKTLPNMQPRYLYVSSYATDPTNDTTIFQYEYSTGSDHIAANYPYPVISDVFNINKQYKFSSTNNSTLGFPTLGWGFVDRILVHEDKLILSAYAGPADYINIYQWDLNTNWDISTVNTSSITKCTIGNYDNSDRVITRGLSFNHDGSQIIHHQFLWSYDGTFSGNDWITIIPLSTPYDLSSWSSSTTSSFNAADYGVGTPNSDGLANSRSGTIYKYQDDTGTFISDGYAMFDSQLINDYWFATFQNNQFINVVHTSSVPNYGFQSYSNDQVLDYSYHSPPPYAATSNQILIGRDGNYVYNLKQCRYVTTGYTNV